MTTKNSPVERLENQAGMIAAKLKEMALTQTGVVKVGIVMDDQILTPKFDLAKIKKITVKDLIDSIVTIMQGKIQ